MGESENQRMIRTLIFDLGKVIIPFDFSRAYERLTPYCGLSPSEIPARLRTTDLVQRYESGQVSSPDFVRQVSEILGLTCDTAEFRDIFCSIFFPETLLPESMFEALAARYRLVLLSNTNELHFEMVDETYPLLSHFHAKVLSYKVGAMKPSPLIYQAAIQAAQCDPSECFFTDDIPAYVEGARALGIDAVVFESREQIERELRTRGIDW